MVAVPAEPKFILPGDFCANAMNSFRLSAGNSAVTMNYADTADTWVTPAKSLTGSNGAVGLMTLVTG